MVKPNIWGYPTCPHGSNIARLKKGNHFCKVRNKHIPIENGVCQINCSLAKKPKKKKV